MITAHDPASQEPAAGAGSAGGRVDARDRWQDEIIERAIPEGGSVLDLGCGGGELLSRLVGSRHIHAQGIECDPEAVMQCIERGVPVIQSDMNEGLRAFPDLQFDFVVLEETLQCLQHPTELLSEMLRVGRRAIVSFPNFGHREVRLHLLRHGTMPVTPWLPHPWYDSPNIHLFTLQDFLSWANGQAIRVSQGLVRVQGGVRTLRSDDNEWAEQALLFLETQPLLD